MKGIVLAGGSGTRLYPLTLVTSKQLLPVYDKPMIYYPQFGISLEYAVQKSPDGIAQAFIIGEGFLKGDSCAMVLGDNIFYGNNITYMLQRAVKNSNEGFATVFGYYVNDPERYGIMEFDSEMNIISVEEKPKKPKSNYCITGLYFYDNAVVEYAKTIKQREIKRGNNGSWFFMVGYRHYG